MRRTRRQLVAFSESGRVLYYNSTYRVYFDVDPVPGTEYTVEYLASKHLSGEDCAGVRTERCTYNVYKRVNLSTGDEREESCWRRLRSAWIGRSTSVTGRLRSDKGQHQATRR